MRARCGTPVRIDAEPNAGRPRLVLQLSLRSIRLCWSYDAAVRLWHTLEYKHKYGRWQGLALFKGHNCIN